MDKIDILKKVIPNYKNCEYWKVFLQKDGKDAFTPKIMEAMQEFSDLTNKSLLDQNDALIKADLEQLEIIHSLRDRIYEIEREKWISVDDKLPDMTGIFLVTQDLQDNQPPITWALIFNRDSKTWTIDDSDVIENNVIAWRELPAPMNTNFKQEPLEQKPVSLDEFERVIYGQCIHGENMANCSICNPNQ